METSDDTTLTPSRTGGTGTTNSTKRGPVRHAALAPGTVLGDRFEIKAVVGTGGMGVVYRATERPSGRTVALKILAADLSDDFRATQRFANEATVAGRITHPSVCEVFDTGTIDGRRFISMEYFAGESLKARLKRSGRLSGEEALRIAIRLCSGLSAAHALNILHRDLKPANVLIDEAGEIRITDFGLASAVDDIPDGELRAGTPAYMSPEQAAGTKPSVQSDLYALGLLLFELFTGERAFKARSPSEYAELHLNAEPPRPSQMAPDIHPSAEGVILA